MSDMTSEQIAALKRRLKRLEGLESGPDWGAVIGRHLALPALRAFWPLNNYDQNGAPYDLSGQERTLTNTNATAGTYNGLVGYLNFNGSTAYLSRADEAGLDITGQITFGGWFWVDVVNATQSLLTKWNGTGSQRAYGLQMLDTSPDQWRAFVSVDGAATVAVAHTATVVANTWTHVVGRYTPSTELAIFVDGVKVTNTTSIPASIFNSSSALRIGSLGDATQYLDGRAALCFLSASALADATIQALYTATAPFFR